MYTDILRGTHRGEVCDGYPIGRRRPRQWLDNVTPELGGQKKIMIERQLKKGLTLVFGRALLGVKTPNGLDVVMMDQTYVLETGTS